MRILRRGICALLALAMIAAMIPLVVVRADEPESTLPVETTLPAETTVPVETTLPADTTAAATEPQFTVHTVPTEVPEQTLPAETAAPTEETVCLSEEDPRPIPTEVTLTELDDADRLYND